MYLTEQATQTEMIDVFEMGQLRKFCTKFFSTRQMSLNTLCLHLCSIPNIIFLKDQPVNMKTYKDLYNIF